MALSRGKSATVFVRDLPFLDMFYVPQAHLENDPVKCDNKVTLACNASHAIYLQRPPKSPSAEQKREGKEDTVPQSVGQNEVQLTTFVSS